MLTVYIVIIIRIFLIEDLQILDIVNALVMEGCITQSDSYEIKSAQHRREQVFIFKSPHTLMAQTFKKYDKPASCPSRWSWI